MISYYKQFISYSITLKSTLLVLLGKDTNYELTSIQDFSFRKLKKKLMAAPNLQYLMRNSDYQIETNASDVARGGVLRILTEVKYSLAAYQSFKFTDGDCRYCIHNKKMLVMLHCLYK